MKVTVKLLGRLRRKLPAGSGLNPAVMDVAEGTTARDLMNILDMPGDRSYLVTVNEESLPPSEYETRKLEENDVVAICPPLQGG